MSWSLAPAVKQALQDANAAWPNRDKSQDGTVGDSSHASRVSDHNPDAQGYVCAVDITHSPETGPTGDQIYQLAKQDPRTKYIISNARIWSPSGGERPYSGSNRHDKHTHISVSQAGKLSTDHWPWNKGEEEDMTPEQAKQLANVSVEVANIQKVIHQLNVEGLLQRVKNIEAAVARIDPEVLDKLEEIKVLLASVDGQVREQGSRWR